MNHKSLFILILIIAGISYAGDTTYAPTEPVRKKRSTTTSTSSNQGTSQSNSSSYRETSSSSSDYDNFFCDCLISDDSPESLKELGGRILIAPFKLAFCGMVYGIGVGIGSSYKHLFVGDPYFDEYAKRIRAGISFGMGGQFTPGIAGGAQFDFSGFFHADIANHFAFRQRIGVRPGIVGITSDFQREVFVNDSSIGYQHDETNDFRTVNFTFSSELLILPAGKRGSFYLFAGGGPVSRYETVDIIRTEEYSSDTREFTQTDWHWVPSVTAGVGRQFLTNRSTGFFELSYSGTFNSNNRELSLPNDNSVMTHAILMTWGFGL